MDEQPVSGMTVSVWTRRDFVVEDPARFLEAAQETDINEAVFALLDRDGELAADGLAPAGSITEVVFGLPTIKSYGCFFDPDDLFTRPEKLS